MINKIDINNKACSIRNQLGEDGSSPIDIFSLAQTIDSLTLIFYPLGSSISGICCKDKNSSVIVINSDMSIGRQRFSLAHELYHLYFDVQMSTSICSIQIDNTYDTETEKEADMFASYLLMPPTALYKKIETYKKNNCSNLSLDEVIRLEQFFGVSHMAMLVRLRQDDYITCYEEHIMKSDIISNASRLGFDVSLYKPSPKHSKATVLGHYIRQAEKLLADEKISFGKYEEFLMAAFREDIVYGTDTEGGNIID